MGWNAGYTIFEATVIGAYDLGKLDKELLAVLMEPYRGTDIDSGGRCNLKTRDGKEIDQVVIETWGLSMPEPPPGLAPEWGSDMTEEERAAYEEASMPWESYYTAIYDRMREVTDFFGWR